MLTERIAQDLASIGRLVDMSPERSLHAVTEIATRGVPGCAGATVAAWRDGQPAEVATSHPGLDALLVVQWQWQEGPVVVSQRGRRPILVRDTMREWRWPRFAAAAVRLGVRSTLVLPLEVEGSFATFGLYGVRAHAFDDRSVAPLASLLAAQLAVVLRNVGEYEDVTRAATQMRQALSSRAEIDQAKGIIMHALGCDADEAFDELRRVSQRSQLKVAEVARQLIREHATGRQQERQRSVLPDPSPG